MQQQTQNNQCRRPSQDDEPPTARTPLPLSVNHRVEVISQAMRYLVQPFRRKAALAKPLNPLYRRSTSKFGVSMKNPLLIGIPNATMRHVSPSSAHGASFHLSASATDWL